jgi:hypothetical protein
MSSVARGDLILDHVSLSDGDESWYQIGVLPSDMSFNAIQFKTLWELHPQDYGKVCLCVCVHHPNVDVFPYLCS